MLCKYLTHSLPRRPAGFALELGDRPSLKKREGQSIERCDGVSQYNGTKQSLLFDISTDIFSLREIFKQFFSHSSISSATPYFAG
jgi:hypothetical protein